MDNDKSLLSSSQSPLITTSIDLSIFKNQSSCKHNKDIKLCQIIGLLLTGLRYTVHWMLKLMKQTNLFGNFIHGIYSHKIIMNLSWKTNMDIKSMILCNMP